MVSRSVTISASPDMEAHSPVAFRKAMLILGSLFRSSVLPDSVLVWKRRSTPPPSYEREPSQYKDLTAESEGINEGILLRLMPCIWM